MCLNNTVFIVDTYNKYTSDNVKSIFSVNGNLYCIKEVELNFGKPILHSIEESEDKSLRFHLYDTYEDAEKFVRELKRISLA